MNEIEETYNYIQKQVVFSPQIGIILGTGLGALTNEIEVEKSLNYKDIPHFPISTVESHSGKLIFGYLASKPVVVMNGRFHYYEGYSMKQITFPVRVMKMLGIKQLIVSNASGGLNPDYQVSDIMIIDDHINLFPENPLIGANMDKLGPRFPDMSEPYDHILIEKAIKIGQENGLKLQKGVYAAVTGPSLETRAEYKYIRNIGADTVGMSTIPEVIVARHMDLKVFAVSVITDLGVEGKIEKVTIEKILKAAKDAEKNLSILMKEMVKIM